MRLMHALDGPMWREFQQAEWAEQQRWVRSALNQADPSAYADLTWRGDANGDIKRHDYLIEPLRKHAPPGATVAVLDVGSGPISYFPKAWLTRRIEITAVDPLATGYPALLKECGINPPHTVQAGQAENLNDLFGPARFDTVYCRNTLEQTIDPVHSLRQMLGMVKPGRCVLLLQEGERTEAQRLRGPWGLSEEDEELMLVDGEDQTNVHDAVDDLVSDVRVSRSWHWPWLLGVLRRRE